MAYRRNSPKKFSTPAASARVSLIMRRARYAVRLLKAGRAPEVTAVPDDPELTARRLDIVSHPLTPGFDQIPSSDAASRKLCNLSPPQRKRLAVE
jgi:hypothetical protein